MRGTFRQPPLIILKSGIGEIPVDEARQRKAGRREVKEVAKRLEHLRTYLESERNRLGEQLHKTDEETGEKREGTPYGKREEASLESSEFEKGLAMEQRTREQLAEVEHALEKFGQGTYGQCDCCGKDIPVARLEAIPQTSVCVECKSGHGGKL